MDELVDKLDENGNTTGEICLKSEAHKFGFWHPCIHIWLFMSNGSVLIQKRSANKKTFPNLWDVSVAGHIGAGEEPVDAAQRELFEELGLDIHKSKFKDIGSFKTDYKHGKHLIDREYHYIYIAELLVPVEELILQQEEVGEVKLRSVSQIKNDLADNKKIEEFVPYSLDYFTTVLNAIEEELKNIKY